MTFIEGAGHSLGPIIAVFVVYHLLHLTTGTVHPNFDVHNVYGNVVLGFGVWPVSAFYVLAMAALGFHFSTLAAVDGALTREHVPGALRLVRAASHRSRDLISGFGELWSARLTDHRLTHRLQDEIRQRRWRGA